MQNSKRGIIWWWTVKRKTTVVYFPEKFRNLNYSCNRHSFGYNHLILLRISTPSSFSPILTKGGNFCDFLFTFLDGLPLQHGTYYYYRKKCAYWETIFFLQVKSLVGLWFTPSALRMAITPKSFGNSEYKKVKHWPAMTEAEFFPAIYR